MEEKLDHLRKFNSAFNTDIKYEDVQYNDAYRSLAKFVLNSFWGRFAMRSNITQNELVSDQHRLVDLLTNEKYVVQDIVPMNEEILLTSYKYSTDAITPQPNLSILVSC